MQICTLVQQTFSHFRARRRQENWTDTKGGLAADPGTANDCLRVLPV